jgi:UPF0176 protein
LFAVYSIITFYHFFPFAKADQASIKQKLLSFADGDQTLGGLVLLSDEGINLSVASERGTEEEIFDAVAALSDLSKTLVKRHSTDSSPFRRLTVDYRQELITYQGTASAGNPTLFEGTNHTHLSPEEWHALLSSGEPLTLIDTRNRYEVEIGTFDHAINPEIDRFSEFPEYLDSNPPPKDRPVLIFCTGGVRCEKAAIDLTSRGYRDVYQLHGGILAYMEQFPEGKFTGECFVFDHRVAVKGDLSASTRWHLCRMCGEPSEQSIACANCNTVAPVCPRCAEIPEQNACSKNCSYHIGRRGNGDSSQCDA